MYALHTYTYTADIDTFTHVQIIQVCIQIDWPDLDLDNFFCSSVLAGWIYVGDDTDGSFADGYPLLFFCNDDHMTSADHGVGESRPLRLWNWTESKPNPKRTMKRATTRSNKYHKTEDGTRENCLKIERRSDFHEVSSGMSKNAVKFMNFANARKSMQTRWDS